MFGARRLSYRSSERRRGETCTFITAGDGRLTRRCDAFSKLHFSARAFFTVENLRKTGSFPHFQKWRTSPKYIQFRCFGRNFRKTSGNTSDFTKNKPKEKVYTAKSAGKRWRNAESEIYTFQKTDCRPARKIRFPQDGSLLCNPNPRGTYFFTFLMQVKRLSYS